MKNVVQSYALNAAKKMMLVGAFVALIPILIYWGQQGWESAALSFAALLGITGATTFLVWRLFFYRQSTEHWFAAVFSGLLIVTSVFWTSYALVFFLPSLGMANVTINEVSYNGSEVTALGSYGLFSYLLLFVPIGTIASLYIRHAQRAELKQIIGNVNSSIVLGSERIKYYKRIVKALFWCVGVALLFLVWTAGFISYIFSSSGEYRATSPSGQKTLVVIEHCLVHACGHVFAIERKTGWFSVETKVCTHQFSADMALFNIDSEVIWSDDERSLHWSTGESSSILFSGTLDLETECDQ